MKTMESPVAGGKKHWLLFSPLTVTLCRYWQKQEQPMFFPIATGGYLQAIIPRTLGSVDMSHTDLPKRSFDKNRFLEAHFAVANGAARGSHRSCCCFQRSC
eukprot:TRINITY_DN16955_c1_g3_i2.p1 TRINITY_DN16955_c1_g3~~TRINITY_DN16955_c1_g3_i2.p1  ORF type:complete len:101 (-),score=2.39 TRINITY_DN16955_c1_g3_i2:81-383(-)